MRRAVLGMVGLALVVLGACARPGTPPGEVALPTGDRLIAEWAESGGFVMPGWLEIRPPRIAVYADGTVIADAGKQTTLSRADLTTLIADLRDGLEGLPATVEPDSDMQVADASTTVLSVLMADGSMPSVSAYALTIQDGYPARLVRVGERMSALSERTVREGSDYTATTVRLIAQPQERAPEDSDGAPAWPSTVPVPTRTKGVYGQETYVLASVDAAVVKAVWPRDINHVQGGWPGATLPDGTEVIVAWRYLLPHE